MLHNIEMYDVRKSCDSAWWSFLYTTKINKYAETSESYFWKSCVLHYKFYDRSSLAQLG